MLHCGAWCAEVAQREQSFRAPYLTFMCDQVWDSEMASQLIFYTHPMSRGRISGRCSKRSDSRIVPSCLTSLWRGWASSDYGLAYAYATARVLRLADGPDEVHRNQIARLEFY